MPTEIRNADSRGRVIWLSFANAIVSIKALSDTEYRIGKLTIPLSRFPQ